MSRRKWTDEQLAEAVRTSQTTADVIRKLGLAVRAGNYRTVTKYIKKLRLDTTHWLGCAHLRGKEHNHRRKRSLSDILVKGSTYTSIHRLKQRLIRQGLLTEQCDECGINQWRDKALSLQLEHINGQHDDHRIENLRLLCPNCHSQTATFCKKK